MNDDIRKALSDVLGKTRRRRRGTGTYRALKDGDLRNPIPLDDFLDGLGGIMQLRPRKLKSEQSQGPAQPISRAAWLRIAMPLAAIVLVGFALQARPAPEPSVALPVGVLGVWTTNDPRYANRSFEITNAAIAFKHGDRADDQSVHQISQVQAQQFGDSIGITIKYLEAGDTYELAFKYVATPKRGIRFSHQEELAWRPLVPKPAPK